MSRRQLKNERDARIVRLGRLLKEIKQRQQLQHNTLVIAEKLFTQILEDLDPDDDIDLINTVTEEWDDDTAFVLPEEKGQAKPLTAGTGDLPWETERRRR